MKFLFGVTCFLLSISLSATTYYVATTGNNSNTGSNTSPFLTIQHGINQLVAGDSLIVEPGTYNEKVLISAKVGTATDNITIVSNGGVIIDGGSLAPAGREGLVSIRNSSYIVFRGFEIRNFTTAGGGPTPVGLLIEGSGSNIEIGNNNIHDISNTSTCTGCAEGAHGLGVFGTTTTGLENIDIIANEVHNNTLQSSEAFVINGNVNGFNVVANTVHSNNNIGFDFIGYEGECSTCGDNDRARNGLVSNNISRNNSSIGNPWYPGTDGSAGGFYVDGGRYIIFEGNESHGNDLGFELASEMPGRKTEDILVVNNYVYNNKEVGIILGGFSANTGASGGGNAERIRVYNNSFYKNKGWGTEIVFQHRVIDCSIANNIFFGEASIGENFDEFGANNTGNTWGRNLWWGSSTAGQGNLPGLLAIANPNFIDPDNGDLSIASFSPAFDIGIDQDDITGWPSSFWPMTIDATREVDFGGNVRIQNVIDLGADELNDQSNASIVMTSSCIEIKPNPFVSRVILEGALSNYTIRVLNSNMQIVTDYSGSPSPLSISLNALGSGKHFIYVQHSTNPNPGYVNVIKY